MSQDEWLTQSFEEHRNRLRTVAYRMLGSISEADDAVQDAWIRVSQANRERGRKPRRLVDDDRCPGLPQHV